MVVDGEVLKTKGFADLRFGKRDESKTISGGY